MTEANAIYPVGESTMHTISRMRDEAGELETGNVVRRACMVAGEQACKQVCQLRGEYESFDEDTTARETITQAIEARSCADINLLREIQLLGLKPEQVLMVGVTGDRVGFADRLDEYAEDIAQNPYGWYELPGFNAFFARVGEVGALGRRLADCADVNFEFKDKDGNTVFGFEHGTRTNMFGSSRYNFEKDGAPMSFTEYAMREAVRHYGADPTSIRIKLGAAIQGHNFVKHFSDREAMETHLPGWYADGFVKNVSNPNWQEGDEVIQSDTWHADTRGMIVRDIREAMARLGVSENNFTTEGIIDPGDSKGMHSSHEFRDVYGDTRDLYITFPRQQ